MRKSVLRALLLPAGALSIGLLSGWWLLVTVLLPTMGLGEVDRIRQLGEHIREEARRASRSPRDLPQQEPAPLTILLGDSVTREGVDADVLRAAWLASRSADFAADSARFENWAVSGCSLVEQRVQLSLALKARPETVVFALAPGSLGKLPDMPLDKAYAYAFAGFDDERWQDALPPSCGLSTDSLAALNAPVWRQQLHFRTAPVSWLNRALRDLLKGRGRGQAAPNWCDPHFLRGAVGPSQLDWHLDLVRGWWDSPTAEQPSNAEQALVGEAVLEQLAVETRRAGARPVFVLTPVHPALRRTAAKAWRRTRPAIQRVATRANVVTLDATTILGSAEFVDALHPNAQGRGRYSQFLGASLRTPLHTARK